jgi:hypothetical protein
VVAIVQDLVVEDEVVLLEQTGDLDLQLGTGISTQRCPAAPAFRIRVSMSAMGSVIMAVVLPLPAGLPDARDLAPQRHLPEADPADPNFR